MWWWTWTAACWHSPSMCAATSFTRRPSLTTGRTPQNQRAAPAACLDACSTASNCYHSSGNAETLDTSLSVQSTATFNTTLTLDISFACSVTQWVVKGKCFVSMYSVFWHIHSWLHIHEPGGIRQLFAFRAASVLLGSLLWTVCTGMMDPFHKMENLQFFVDSGNLLWTSEL